MEQEEQRDEFSPPLALLPRLDRLERLLQFLEERRHSLPARQRQRQRQSSLTSTLSFALDEVSHKGSLLERLVALENRVLKLSLELHIGNTDISSRSNSEEKASENRGLDGAVKMVPVVMQEYICTSSSTTTTTSACETKTKPPKGSTRNTVRFKCKKLRRWFRMGC